MIRYKTVPENESIVYDVEVAFLCHMLHKLPSEIFAEDPKWLLKLQLILGEKARAEEDAVNKNNRHSNRRGE